jgi:hypothetical protein
VQAIADGFYDEALGTVTSLGSMEPGTNDMTDDVKKLKELYVARQMEPHAEEDSWTPDDNYATLTS